MFILERMFKLVGKTHYSKLEIIPNWNPIDSIISTGLSALAFTSSPVLAFIGKLPIQRFKAENTCFSREVMIAILLGSFSVPVFTNIIQDTSKKTFQNESCKF